MMLRITLILLSVIGLNISSMAGKKDTKSDKFRMEFKVEGLEGDSQLIIANYFGLKQYYYDTAFAVSKGVFVHETDSIKGGIYLVVLPDKSSYFEVMVDGKEREIKMQTNIGNLVEDMNVITSDENKKFYYFQKMMGMKSLEAAPIQERMKRYQADESGKYDDSLKIAQTEMDKLNKEVVDFKLKFIEENEGTFVAKIFKTSQEPQIPENDSLEGDELNEWKYNYFKENYLKDVDFTDERLLRTPVLGKKIEYYIQKLTVQIPDSINKAADMMARMAKPDREVYKYVVHWITNTYEKSKIMGMDGVFVHMADSYYCTEEGAWWIDSASTAKICERADALRPLLIGKVAENIILPDTTENNWYNVHSMEGDLTILVFWSPTCGHCKKAVPMLETDVYQVFKGHGINIVGISTELENTETKKFIKNKKLTFLNLSDSKEINTNAHDYMRKGITTLNSLNFRSFWDVYSTPQVYVLDKDKKIIAKKLGIEQLAEFINDWRKTEGMEPIELPKKEVEGEAEKIK